MKKKAQQQPDVNIGLHYDIDDIATFLKDTIALAKKRGAKERILMMQEDLLTIVSAVQQASVRIPDPKTLN